MTAERTEPHDHERSPRRALVALGSNLGNRLGFLRAAVEELPGVVAVSHVWETDPIGGPAGQGPFLNMVAELRTTLDPLALLHACQAIEAAHGRQRDVHWGPRTLDIDLLFYEGTVVDSAELTVPHPRWAERDFVLAPLSQVAPDLLPPGWDLAHASGVRDVGRLP